MNSCRYLCVLLILLLAVFAPAQEITSGPDKGANVPGLKVFDVTGEFKDKEVDYAAKRKDKPTIYVFIQAEKFDRPMNRFLLSLIHI